MKALILAAGYGNRMRPLTYTKHKTLLTVNNKTIIGRIIDGLYDNGVRNIIVVTGYLADDLSNYLVKNYSNIKFEFIHNPRYRETNNIYSLALAMTSTEIDDDLILIESDLVYDSSVIKRIINSKYTNVALVDKFRSGMDGTVVTIQDNVITSIIPTHLQGTNFNFSDKYKTLNIYKFSKEFCNTTFKQLLTYYAKIIDDNCYYELILGILIYMQRETIYAEIINGEEWSEVDDPNDLNVCEFIFNKDNRLNILEKTFGGYWAHNILDFCFIRNMYFPSSSMLSEMKNNLPMLIQNYGSKQEILNEKLSYFLLYKKENLNLLSGASQVYPILKNLYSNKKVLMPSPTFGEYSRVFSNREFYYDEVGIDFNEIEKKGASCDIVVFVNPNNPTGSLISADLIYKYAEKNSGKLIIVDESFIDFANSKSIIDLLEEKPMNNILTVKSLSKLLGIPGIRLGFTYSTDSDLNKKIFDALPIWNINSLGEYFLEICLKHRNCLNQAFKKTIKDRENFIRLLSKQNFIEKAYPSKANFILTEFKKNDKSLEELVKHLLAKNSIYVKDISKKFSNNIDYLRLAVRLPEENERLVKCMKEFYNSSK